MAAIPLPPKKTIEEHIATQAEFKETKLEPALEAVLIRSHFTRHPTAQIGATGVVMNILSSDVGDLFQLHFDDGHDDYFVRGEIRKPHDEK